MAEFDIDGARKAGITDTAIADDLAPKLGFDIVGAREAGHTDKDIADSLASKFNSTPGWAATGNPIISGAGARQKRSENIDLGPLLTVAGAALGGGVGGLVLKEALIAGGGALGGSSGLMGARTAGSKMIDMGLNMSRPAATAAGAVSGFGSEVAGQAVEVSGGGPVSAEVARFIGGAVGPDLAKVPYLLFKATGKIPLVADVMAAVKKYAGREVVVPERDLKYIEEGLAGIRGRGGKTDAPLGATGTFMGEEADRYLKGAELNIIRSTQAAAGYKPTGVAAEMSEVGGSLRDTINTRHKYALKVRSDEYSANEKARDAIVVQREGAGQTVNTLPEYQAIVSQLRSQLDKIPLSQRAGYLKVIEDFENGGNSMSFDALDRMRRKFGDAFRGRPAEGYEALGESTAKDLYKKVSEVQKKYAGSSQAKLLDDYADRTEGLQVFSSKLGKKSTALDQYREEMFATDASTLPATFFKTKASVRALAELTGNNAQVENAALHFANKELEGKKSAGVRTWMRENSDWLKEVGATRKTVENYANGLEAVERSSANAADFAAKSTAKADLLVGKHFPIERAKDLILSGNTKLWDAVIPGIRTHPQAQVQLVEAIKQVVADKATEKGTLDIFNRSIRPAMEKAGISNKAEMDFIADRLKKVQEMNVPEVERLGWIRRILLQSAGGWASSQTARTVNPNQWSKEKMVPD